MTFGVPSVWCANENGRFPMQDLFMAPLAAAALAEIDAGRLRLNEAIAITQLDLSPPPSWVNPRVPAGDDARLSVPAADLIALAVQEGDNTAADVIMKRIGGPGAVTAWLRGHDINDMRIDRYERELQTEISGLPSFRPAWTSDAAWTEARSAVPPGTREAAMAAYLDDPRDTTTAQAALNFLNRLAEGTLLSRASTDLLLRLMSSPGHAPRRLSTGLPGNAKFAHKTGSSVADLGLTMAANDMGLVTLAGGRHFAIVALLSGSTATAPQRQKLFTDAARLAVSALT
jgi:beta-lactamase class A